MAAAPDEFSTLTAHLDAARNSVTGSLTGLSEGVAHRPGIPSGRSLAGLIGDLAVSERYWFGFVFAGGPEEDWEFGGRSAIGVTVPVLLDRYARAVAASNQIIHAAPDLSTLAVHPPFREQTISLRWVMTHMIQETSRYAGHAEVLREQAERLGLGVA